METKDFIFSLAIIILLILTIIFGVRSGTNKAKAEAAQSLIEPLITVLKAYDYPRLYPSCRTISRGEIGALQLCLEQSIEDLALQKRFRQAGFRNVDAKSNRSGYLVIENEKGGLTFDSDKFVLSQNNKVIARNCSTPGEIKPGFTCRFNLKYPCEPGDNLEVTYDGVRAFLKTC